MSEENEGERSHEPTQKRLDEARKRGEIIRSTEVTAAAAYAGLLLAMLVFGAQAVRGFGEVGTVLLDQADRLAPLILAEERGPFGGLILAALRPFLPFFLLPAGAVLLALVAQRAFVFAPEKLSPKLSRISPLSNAAQKFGTTGLFDFARGLLKLLIIAVLLVRFTLAQMPRIMQAADLSAGAVALLLLDLTASFLTLVFVVAVVIGAVDYLWQRFSFLRRHRMSRKEIMDEVKESEGDPHLEQERRFRAQEIAMNQMLADIPTASVVIVNPTHYAVALRWSRTDGGAPTCVAKGVDLIAARIREVARENGIPIHSDPPTARALHATVDIGAQIRREHYRAVAAAIRFAERLQKSGETS